MIIDNRKLMPLGSYLLVDQPEEGTARRTLFVHTHDSRVPRQCALPAADGMKHGLHYAIVEDPAADPHGVVEGDGYTKRMLARLKSHVEANTPRAVTFPQVPYPRAQAVVILGAGPVSEKDLELVEELRPNVKIITVGSAIRKITPDYHVHTDPLLPDYFAELQNLSEVNAYLALSVNPALPWLGWKSVQWFCHQKVDGLPVHYASESVSTDALQFACKRLGATTIVLLGFEHPLDRGTGQNVYWWSGLVLQAHCWWYSRNKIDIWNCSRPTSIHAGVVLATLEEALFHILSSRRADDVSVDIAAMIDSQSKGDSHDTAYQ